ncbi:hypothetical protein [uncultured Roseibium sp.]|uniref:alpha/beta hydrolase family esterase n=1 Tax=uncultured Roseibium sp. TaxID=1936171 RepID=UPI00262F19B5|nr:hypothetical protein [uncultured Roseibium sp.]
MKNLLYSLLVGILSPAYAAACEPGAACQVDTGFYRYEVPETIAGPLPLIVFLHGYASSSERVINVDRVLVDNAIKKGFAFLAAEGTVAERDGALNGWSVWPGFPGIRDDRQYIWEAIDDFSEKIEVDRSRIYLVGFSLGGSATLDTACKDPEGFAGFAVLNGAMWNPLPESCVSNVSIFQTHAFADDVLPLEGLRYDQVTSGDVFAGFGLFRQAAGNLQPDSFDFTGEYWCRSWDDDARRFCLYGGNHDWPLSWMPQVTQWIEHISAANQGN